MVVHVRTKKCLAFLAFFLTDDGPFLSAFFRQIPVEEVEKEEGLKTTISHALTKIHTSLDRNIMMMMTKREASQFSLYQQYIMWYLYPHLARCGKLKMVLLLIFYVRSKFEIQIQIQIQILKSFQDSKDVAFKGNLSGKKILKFSHCV